METEITTARALYYEFLAFIFFFYEDDKKFLEWKKELEILQKSPLGDAQNFEILKKLKPDNITFHALAQKVGSKYFEENINGNESESIKIAKDIEIFTQENSYKPYYLYRQKNIIGNLENIGYEKENTSQRYNILINEELENIIGLGMNANSKLMNGKKYRNERNLRRLQAKPKAL